MKIFKRCPKTGRVIGVNFSGFNVVLFPFLGLLALIWVAIRVIPRPSRITYPCMKVAMPLATGFLAWFGGIFLSAYVFVKARKHWLESRYFLASTLVVVAFGIIAISTSHDYSATPVKLQSSVHEADEPMGEAKGIFPGRVVWVYNPDATNEDCDPNTAGDGWFLEKNNDQSVIDSMVSNGIHLLTGEESDEAAWDAIFKFHNNTRGKGEVAYNDSEKVFIKINMTSGWSGNYNVFDLSKVENSSYGISETSPQMMLSVLRQLVNVVGVPEENIYIGDPIRHMYKHIYEYLHGEFPDVHYMDHNGYSDLGREPLTADTSAEIFYSDRGTILKTNVWYNGTPGDDVVTDDCLYSIFDEAEYIINLPMLKGHKRAGITAFAKNHFGSQTRDDACHLHNGLVAPTEMPYISRPGYGLYRVQVDLMGHEILGKKNLLYLLDALWTADQEISYPKKFYMEPFNGDWMSSVFVSLDPVAIESVGYDFLRTEFTEERDDSDGAGTYVQMEGVDDYLHQAADSSNWPDSIKYDPENDGTLLGSLGVHEHWNNAEDKQYSRNLGTGDGIELVQYSNITSVEDVEVEDALTDGFVLHQNYPNPFNPTTNISFYIKEAGNVRLEIFNPVGQRVKELVDGYYPIGTHKIVFDASGLSSGIYFYRLQYANKSITKKCLLVK